MLNFMFRKCSGVLRVLYFVVMVGSWSIISVELGHVAVIVSCSSSQWRAFVSVSAYVLLWIYIMRVHVHVIKCVPVIITGDGRFCLTPELLTLIWTTAVYRQIGIHFTTYLVNFKMKLLHLILLDSAKFLIVIKIIILPLFLWFALDYNIQPLSPLFFTFI